VKVHIETFGCQMNKLDSELVLGALLEGGFERAPSVAEADIVLFNTCSVRRHAEERVYSRLGALKPLKEKRPELILGVIGCMAQKEQEVIFRRAPHVDLVCGTYEIAELPTILRELAPGRGRCLRVAEREIRFGPRHLACRPVRHQAYVLIMRGCDNFCSYCVVPHVRGREQSRPVADILSECQSLVADGVKEITLLGQNVDSYGKSLGDGTSLASLLRAVHQIRELERLRFVTSHPKDISSELLQTMAELPKVCRHLHMPAQSGSDRILRAMNRGYSAARYQEIVAEARRRMPDVQIASDFIVGFPGETEEDFRESVRLIQELRFQNCFIFKYSPREGTAAAKLTDDVPDPVKQQRNQVLLKLQEQISRERHAALVGSIVEVLADGPSKSDQRRLSGRTRGNDIVVFGGARTLAGKPVRVKINDSTPLTLFGELV
jgi:tRNA-2-methylthio-N6-dimethylallyladenosine synthase